MTREVRFREQENAGYPTRRRELMPDALADDMEVELGDEALAELSKR